MKPLVVEIFFYTDEGRKLIELDIKDEIPLEECEPREVTFYRVDALSPYKEEGDFCAVYCNGTSYIAKITYEDAKKHVES